MLSKISQLRPRKLARMQHSIKLNKNESQLKELLLKVSDYINQKKICEPIELRFAGGWVRDKLLDKNSDDIDIAINSLTGIQFIESLQEYLKLNSKKLFSIGKIQSNPDKSKHLETVTFKLFGLEIDMVNLRSETYSNTRIPDKMEFGTPEQDALRRDITINSLFYNLNKDIIEDYSNKGLEDLKLGIIRTPLSSIQTFLDDPLRVLRCIRFAARFNFKLDNDIIDGSKNEDIKYALRNKISKERIGIEISKMLKDNYPLKAFELIHQLGLYNVIFHSSTDITIENTNPEYNITVADKMNYLLNIIKQEKKDDTLPIEQFKKLDFDRLTINQNWLLLAAFMAKYRHLEIQTNKFKPVKLIYQIVKDEIKFPVSTAYFIVYTYDAQEQFDQLLKLDAKEWNRCNVGLVMQRSGEKFFGSILMSLAIQLAHKQLNIIEKDTLDHHINQLQLLLNFIFEERLFGVHLQQPLLSGAQIQKALNIKPGKIIGLIKFEVTKMQLLNPSWNQKNALEWVKNTFNDAEIEKLKKDNEI